MTSKRILFSLFFVFSLLSANSQISALISGRVINGFTKEPIPFSTIRWIYQKTGAICDSLGNFNIVKSRFNNDTLVLDYVGFDPNMKLRPGYCEMMELFDVGVDRLSDTHIRFNNGFAIFSKPFESVAEMQSSPLFEEMVWVVPDPGANVKVPKLPA